MIVLKLLLGVFFFFLGWIYLYKSNIVLMLNKIAREVLFNDRLVLLGRKKVAILFFCLSFVALYMGITSLGRWVDKREKNNWVFESNKYLMYMAMQDYCREQYGNAIEKYEKVLKLEPDNLEVLKRLAYTYDAQGDKKKARAIWKRILRLSPGMTDKEIQEKLKSIEK
jgi:tetratricopeptide (TPR) repeat protein